MRTYVLVGPGKWVVYNDRNDETRVVIKTDLQAEVTRIESRLEDIPEAPTNQQLLKWAKENYPVTDYTVEKLRLSERLAELQEILSNLNG